MAPHKSKFLLACSRELWNSCLCGQNHSIKVEDKVVCETKSEKLLGLFLDQDLPWKTYLWGENWRDENNWPGLLPQLTKRVGLIRKLSHTLPKKALKSIAAGLFYSKLLYALPGFGNTWGFLGYKEKEPKRTTTTKGDMEALQRLQKRVTRVTLGKTGHDLPTEELLKQGKGLSVHQLSTSNMVVELHKAMISGRPDFVVKKCSKLPDIRTQQGTLSKEISRLCIWAESFFPRAIKIYNHVLNRLKQLGMADFKKEVTKWIKLKVSIKP